jgi:hypothetical protein
LFKNPAGHGLRTTNFLTRMRKFISRMFYVILGRPYVGRGDSQPIVGPRVPKVEENVGLLAAETTGV